MVKASHNSKSRFYKTCKETNNSLNDVSDWIDKATEAIDQNISKGLKQEFKEIKEELSAGFNKFLAKTGLSCKAELVEEYGKFFGGIIYKLEQFVEKIGKYIDNSEVLKQITNKLAEVIEGLKQATSGQEKREPGRR